MQTLRSRARWLRSLLDSLETAALPLGISVLTSCGGSTPPALVGQSAGPPLTPPALVGQSAGPPVSSASATSVPSKPIVNVTLTSVGLDPLAIDRSQDPC